MLSYKGLSINQQTAVSITHEQPAASSVITPELVETLRSLLAQTTVREEANTGQLLLSQGEQGTNNGQRVKAYLALHPDAKVREVADALSISVSTANKWMGRVKA